MSECLSLSRPLAAPRERETPKRESARLKMKGDAISLLGVMWREWISVNAIEADSDLDIVTPPGIEEYQFSVFQL
jgi:hypothetical protein